MSDRVRFHDGTVLLNVHTQDQCAGQPCAIHNPSNHHMASWEPRWDSDSKMLWRRCEHLRLHPDPDDLSYLRRRGWISRAGHLCDGCCQPPSGGDSETLQTGREQAQTAIAGSCDHRGPEQVGEVRPPLPPIRM